MISNLNGNAQLFLAGLDRVQRTATRAEREMSSGSKVMGVEDDPEDLPVILQLSAGLDLNTQIQTNLGNARTMATAADDALQTGVNLMDRANTLAEEALNTLSTAASRQSSASEVAGLLQQMVTLSRTQAGGRYVFSGDSDTAPSYQLDSSGAVQRLMSPTNTVQITDITGVSFGVTRTAQQIFDARDANDNPTADNVFTALSSLQTALANNDTAGIQAAATAVSQAGDYLNSQLSFYGAIENRIDNSLDLAQKFQTRDQTALSGKKDADIAADAVLLTQSQIGQQAALSAQANQPQKSLFDFLA